MKHLKVSRDSQYNVVETTRKLVIAIKLSIRKLGSSSVLIMATEYPSLRIEGFEIVNLRCVSTKLYSDLYYKELKS